MNKKIKLIIAGALLPLVLIASLFMMPIIIGGAAIAVPFQFIGGVFQSIGDFFSGNDDVTRFLDQWFKTDYANEVLTLVYRPYTKQNVDIPMNYFVIPAMMVGIERPDKEYFDAMIAASISDEGKLLNPNKYAEALKKDKLWGPLLEVFSSGTIAKYISKYINIGAPFIPQDVLDAIPENEWLYPHIKSYKTSDEFGWRILNNKNNWHTGIDLKTGCSTPIYASHDGVVANTQSTRKIADYGNYISIRFVEGNTTYIYMYAHLRNPVLIPKGTEIKRGDFVGYTGDTGLSYGCHLHFQINKNGSYVNPRTIVNFNVHNLPQEYRKWQQNQPKE